MNNMHDKSKIITMGSDHAGYDLKEYLKDILINEGYNIKDYGCFSKESCDYPDIIHPLAKDIDDGRFEKGIIICGSGNGVQITANKYQNIRAALCWNKELASLSRQHNNANILALPARFIKQEEAIEIVNEFLNTMFEGGRHENRVKKIKI
jgi:ribose 5-phosphate isomerase B